MMMLRCTRITVVIVAFFIVSSLILLYQILHLGSSLPSRHLINLSGATSDRLATFSSPFTSEYEDEEHYHLRAYSIPEEPYRVKARRKRIQSRSSGPVRSSRVVFAQPPPRHDDCVIDFTNVQIIDGEKIVIYADADDVYADLSRVGNVGVYENRASLSLFGNPLSPLLSIQFEIAPRGQTSYNTTQCRTHTTKPTFIFSARDHVLGNYFHFFHELFAPLFFTIAHPSRHALFPVQSSLDWAYEQNETSTGPTAKASSKVHPFHHPHGNAIRDSRHDANWAVRKWIKNNVLIPYGSIYSAYDVRYESFTHNPVRPLNPESQDSMDEWKGIHCFDQLTLSISTNISVHNRIHSRSELQPLLDFMDDAYQIRTEYSARQLGWKYFKDSLETSRPLLIFSYRKYPQRFLHNETLIMEIVESVGFRMEIVSFGKLETKKMIETMRSAHVLMGVHGAGLSNSVFLHAGATMFLLMNPQHPVQKNPLSRMAKNVGANYIELEIHEYPDGSCYIEDFRKFKQKLEEAMRHVERLASSTTWSPPAIPELRPIYPFPINYCAVRQWHSSYD